MIRLLLLISTLLAVSSCATTPPIDDLSAYDFREGDIILQHMDIPMGDLIVGVTRSPYSHCGIVARVDGELVVIEGAGPVRYTPLAHFLNRGEERRFTQVRPTDVTAAEIAASLAEAAKLLERPYDFQYEFDDQKIYCSELVYKAFKRGADREIGRLTPLRAFNWQPHEPQIRELAGGDLPLDRRIVSPGSVADDDDVELIYSTFPHEQEDAE